MSKRRRADSSVGTNPSTPHQRNFVFGGDSGSEGESENLHRGRVHAGQSFRGSKVPSSGFSASPPSASAPSGVGLRADDPEGQARRAIIDNEFGLSHAGSDEGSEDDSDIDMGAGGIDDSVRQQTINVVGIKGLKKVLGRITGNLIKRIPTDPNDAIEAMMQVLGIEVPPGTILSVDQVEEAWSNQARTFDLLRERLMSHGTTDGIPPDQQDALVDHILFLKRIVFNYKTTLMGFAVSQIFAHERNNWASEAKFGKKFTMLDSEDAEMKDHYHVLEELLEIAEMNQAMRKGEEIYVPRRQPDGTRTHTMLHKDSVKSWMFSEAAKDKRPDLWRKMINSKSDIGTIRLLSTCKDTRLPELQVSDLHMAFQNAVLNIDTLEVFSHDDPRIARVNAFVFINHEFPMHLANVTNPKDVLTPNMDIVMDLQGFNGDKEDEAYKFKSIFALMKACRKGDVEITPQVEARIRDAREVWNKRKVETIVAQAKKEKREVSEAELEPFTTPLAETLEAKGKTYLDYVKQETNKVWQKHRAYKVALATYRESLTTEEAPSGEERESLQTRREALEDDEDEIWALVDALYYLVLVPVYQGKEKYVKRPYIPSLSVEVADEDILVEKDPETGLVMRYVRDRAPVLPPKECKFCKKLYRRDNVRLMSAKERFSRLGEYIDKSGQPREDDPDCAKPWDHFPWVCTQTPGSTIRAFMARPLFPFRRDKDNLQSTMLYMGNAGTGKSTLLEIMASFFDQEDVGVVAPNCEEKWWVGYIYDKRFAFFPELSENMQASRAAVQEILSNGFVGVALKNKKQKMVQWPRYFAGGAGNIVPIEWTDTKKSLLRRLFISMFTVTPENVDETLLERCLAERPAIIYRCLLEYHKMLAKTKAVDKANRKLGASAIKSDYFLITSNQIYTTLNLLFGFLHDEAGILEFGPDHYITYTGLWRLFSLYVKTNHSSRKNKASDRTYYEGLLPEFGIVCAERTMLWPRDEACGDLIATNFYFGVGAKNHKFED